MKPALELGDQVEKSGGDYRYKGTVVAIFQKVRGEWRIVVENLDGVLMIMNEAQVQSRSKRHAR